MTAPLDVVSAVFDRIGLPVLTAFVLMLFVMQWRWPLRRRVQSLWRRMFVNSAVSFPGFAFLRLIMIPVWVWLAMQNEQHWHFGLNYLYALPFWLEFGIGFLLLDWFIYVWHVLTHKIPLLWRFHLVHHTDLDLDVLTAFRFHAGELFFSVFFRGAAVVLVGASPMLVLVYEIVFEACTSFHHSNWRLPGAIERMVNSLLVTPRMHGIHHSTVVKERDSNWGTVFSFWDRLHGTLYLAKPQEEIVIGEAPYQDARELTVRRLLLMPFWRLPPDDHIKSG